MMSYIFSLLLYLILFLPSVTSWAQSVCPKDFSQISTKCIVNAPLKYNFDKDYIEIKEKKEGKETKKKLKAFILNSELKDDIWFYKTPSGQVGKLKVISTLTKKSQCTFYLDAITYDGDKFFIPNSSITIALDNNWLKERIFLDKEGSSAIELIRLEGQCRVVFSEGVQVATFFNQNSEDVEIWKESYDLLKWTPAVLIFIAIFVIVRLFMEEQDKFKTQEALEEAENLAKVKNQAIFIKLTRPFYKRYFLPLTEGKNKQKYRNLYKQKLANAGLTKDITPEEFMALKFFMILGGPFAFLIVRFIMEESWPLSITPVMGLVGYIYPNIWVNGLIKKRADDILRAMPFIIDMLALSVEAGLDFMAAIQRVIEKAPKSPLVEEFETLIRETKIGSSRAEGLRQLGWRVNIIEINSFCATLIAADSVGASIGPILKQLSGELRVKRSSRAEQAGATAATKILIPMIFFILPAVLVAIFAPMVLKMMSGGDM
jgi:tight adherence protein C